MDLERKGIWRSRWDSSGLGFGTLVGCCKSYEFYKNLENCFTEMMVILMLMFKLTAQGLPSWTLLCTSRYGTYVLE